MPKATALKEYVTAAFKLLSAYGKSFHWARYFLGEAGLQATQLYAFADISTIRTNPVILVPQNSSRSKIFSIIIPIRRGAILKLIIFCY